MISSILPSRAVEGGRVTLHGSGFPVDDDLPVVSLGDQQARAVFASSTRIVITIPPDLESGTAPVRLRDAASTAFFTKRREDSGELSLRGALDELKGR